MSDDGTTAHALNADGVTEIRFERDAAGNLSNAEPIEDAEVILFGKATLETGQRISITTRMVWD
jgi:hypothetical protein